MAFASRDTTNKTKNTTKRSQAISADTAATPLTPQGASDKGHDQKHQCQA
jgi:hypothetical protein